jgi:putative phage-type endonuclease
MADLTDKLKSGLPGAKRTNYMGQLLAERLTGEVITGYKSSAMRHGTDTEPEARKHYAFFTNATVTEAGFVLHPSISEAGASPDSFVGEDGLLEIKCPDTKNHADTLLSEEIPEQYLPQCHWQMACTGRKWVDFVSYDPRMPGWGMIFIKRLPRDEEVIAALEKDVVAFLNELRGMEHRLKAKYDPDNSEVPEVVRQMAAG